MKYYAEKKRKIKRERDGGRVKKYAKKKKREKKDPV